MATLPGPSGLGREWFISPDFTMPPPPDGPLRLGALLADPKDVYSIVWDARDVVPASMVFRSAQDRYEFCSSRTRDKGVGVWASFLSLGLGAEAATSREDSIRIACDRLETYSFNPAMEFIGECLEYREVKAWTRARRRKPLYMVTGIKVAQGAQLRMEQRKPNSFNAGAELGSVGIGVDVVAAGVPISVGPSVSVSKTVISGFESASYGTDFVFAYKLRKLKFSEVKPYLRTHDAGAQKETQAAAAVPSSPTKAGPDQSAPSQPPEAHVFWRNDTEDPLEVETEEVNAPDTDEPLRILSLDGGGVRGISSLLLLQKIMNKVREERDLQGQVKTGSFSKGPKNSKQPIRPCQYFDLICGTSTGGLIAILLGRLQCTVEKCIEHYEEMAKKIFNSKAKQSEVLFDAKVLEECVKHAIKDARLPEDEPLADIGGCKTFVVATATMGNGAEPFLLRTYKCDSEIPSPFPCKIWEAARATSAAPSFFEPISIATPDYGTTTFGEKTDLKDQKSGGGSGVETSSSRADRYNGTQSQEYSDGGLTANNPAFQALMELGSIWGSSGSGIRRRLACLVSIGTGIETAPKLNRGKDWVDRVLRMFSPHQAIRLATAKYCVDIALSCEKTHVQVLGGLKTLGYQNRYFRLNVPSIGEIPMFDWEAMGPMKRLTENHIRDDKAFKEAEERLGKIIHNPDYQRDEELNKLYNLHEVIPTKEPTFMSSLVLPAFQDLQGQGNSQDPNLSRSETKEEPRQKDVNENSTTQNGAHQKTPAAAAADQAKSAIVPAPAKKPTYPWTWPTRNNHVATIQSVIFYHYDKKTKSNWNHIGNDRKDQTALSDRRDEGESAVAVLELKSKCSFVSSKFVDRWKLKTHDLPSTMQNTHVRINETEVRCEKFVWLTFRCSGFGMQTQRQWFRVLESDEVEIVFGSSIFFQGSIFPGSE